MVNRRQFLQYSGLAGAGLAVSGRFSRLLAVPLVPGLSDPALQPKFMNLVPDALSPTFKHRPIGGRTRYEIGVRQTLHQTGLVDPLTNALLSTAVWGYADKNGRATWPGKTIEAWRDRPVTVRWTNDLVNGAGGYMPHLLPVDRNLHWAYSLPGYQGNTIAASGVPLVPHLHGGHTESDSDGNPEYFFSPGFGVKGPRWAKEEYLYDNDQAAGTLWYHDHALGITRLNVYAGLAGFYILRDALDDGKRNNPLGLPVSPYETALAIQDRMFTNTGALFYPAFPGDPAYDDFITGEGATLPGSLFPNGGPSALAEFFGDHMVVNGLIWPKMDVEPRNYRMRLLNGCDSRFLVCRFRVAASAAATDLVGAGAPLPFHVIGSDQGLAAAAVVPNAGHAEGPFLVIGPGERYDVVIDFAQVPAGSRVIMENIGGDAPFGGSFGAALEPDDLFPNRQTDRIMAFDVVLPYDTTVPERFNPTAIASYGGNTAAVTRTRKVALFEGTDEYGRLQPLLGTVDPGTDANGNPAQGSMTWHAGTTENPNLNATEVWEIHNTTMDAHPIHLHLVNFEVLNRQDFTGDLDPIPVMQHNGEYGGGYKLHNVALSGAPVAAPGHEKTPKDTVIALPGQVTRVKATFDRPGRYVWHCHILSHEDHEMMRVLHVGPGAGTNTTV